MPIGTLKKRFHLGHHMHGHRSVSNTALHVSVNKGSSLTKQVKGVEQDEGVAALVSDTGRANFSADLHPQLTIGTTATGLLELIRVAAGSLTAAQRTALGMTSTADLPDAIIAKRGIIFKADPTNTGTIYLGTTHVSATSPIVGFPLAAGDSLFIEITDANNISFDATAAGQIFSWLAI